MSNAAILAVYREQPIAMDELVSGTKWLNLGGLYRMEIQAITPGNEAAYGLQWLYSTLSGDPTLSGIAVGGVWRGVADAGAATPFVVISLQSPGLDSLTMTAVRLFSNPLFAVKAVGPASSTGSIVAAASAIDALLGRTPSIAYI